MVPPHHRQSRPGSRSGCAEFPYSGPALNTSTIHPDYIAFAERVLGTDRIMLSHGQLGGKYAGTRDSEQELHRDYGNNTLAVPPPDPPSSICR